jgi:hypothetical protein
VLPCLFHRLLLGAEAFELFGGFVLTAEKVALAQPLALGKPFLSGTGEAREEFLILLRPRPRRLDGRQLDGGRIGGFGLLTRILRSIRAFAPVAAVNRSGVFRGLRGRFGGRAAGVARAGSVVVSLVFWRSLRSTAAASCDDSAAGVSAGAVTSMA